MNIAKAFAAMGNIQQSLKMTHTIYFRAHQYESLASIAKELTANTTPKFDELFSEALSIDIQYPNRSTF